MSTAAVPHRNGPPRMPDNILFKLFGFTIVLFIFPILSFFISKNYIFEKNGEIYSGVIAVIMANLVILIYIWAVFNDDEIDEVKVIKKKKSKDDTEEEEEENEEKDSQDQKKKIKEKEILRKRKV